VLVLAEFLKNCVGVHRHLVVVLVLGGELVNERVDHENALFGKDVLHLFLFNG